MLTISEMLRFNTYEDRLDYLRLEAANSELTFADLRYLNQTFYNSIAWKRARQEVIARDMGYDLAIPGRHISGKVIVHHMNPLKPKDLYFNSEGATNPEFLVTVSHITHEAIHFGFEPPPQLVLERIPGDTTLW